MKLLLDITRVATRIIRSGPTGIDRVEFAYAKEILRNQRDFTALGTITMPVFTGALRQSRVDDVLGRVEAAWGLSTPPTGDPTFNAVKAWLEAPLAANDAKSARFRGSQTSALMKRALTFFPARDVIRARTRLGRWITREREKRPIYFHASHTQLDNISRFAWLKEKNVPAVFLLHDTIPIDFPEFCSPGGRGRHIARLSTVSQLASLVIVNSEFSARSVKAQFKANGLRAPEIEKIPLGVDELFVSRAKLAPPEPPTPYFVYVGTIEPRKNLTFLLTVWRRLIERLGPAAPRLLLVGRRGWEIENVIDVLERSVAIAPYVAEASDLTDAGLASLLAGATALVAPSLVEGFGLPIVESLSLGVPVLASNIPAHQEAGGEFAHYLDPVDGPAWIEALEQFSRPNSTARAQAVEKIAHYRPMLWRDHVDRAIDLLRRKAAE